MTTSHRQETIGCLKLFALSILTTLILMLVLGFIVWAMLDHYGCLEKTNPMDWSAPLRSVAAPRH